MNFLVIFSAIFLAYFFIQFAIRYGIVERASRTSAATNPGRIKPKGFLLYDLAPGLYPHSLLPGTHWERLRVRIFIARQLWHGASNPAVVVQENPLIIAAYAADCDAVLLVRFYPESNDKVKKRGFGLRLGSRLLSVNTYLIPEWMHPNDETVLGPYHSSRWNSFRPYIAEYMSVDRDIIEKRKREIEERLWERTKQLGISKLQDANLDEVRWGNPMYAEVPRSYQLAIGHAEHWDMPY